MKAYHGPGTCTFFGTANSNQMVMEMMGLHLPGAAFVHPNTPLRDALTAAAARRAVEIGVDEVYAQRLVYFDLGLAVEEQSVYRHLSGEQERLLAEAAAICAAAGVPFRASGNTPPEASLRGDGAPGRAWQACQRPWTLAYVSADGNVYPCCFVPFVEQNRETTILGNAFEEPLSEIWNGPRYQEFRRRFLGDRPFDCCKDCGSKWSL